MWGHSISRPWGLHAVGTIVVGRGLGGSVISYRLAEAGLSVCLQRPGRSAKVLNRPAQLLGLAA